MSAHPIIPGFHPDPSICRVGNEYYLVTSTFEYFPGVPVFHSRDLLNWEQVGNVLSREAQLNVRSGQAGASGGIFAPTIRHHGEFWMVTTNIDDYRKGQLIVRAADPAGEWSDPVHVAGALGIDPDLAWDDAGTCYLTWSNRKTGITQAVVDPVAGRLLSGPRSLWFGTGLADPEAPHLIRRGDWWYLLIAEGGTGRGHSVTVARSRSITGPFRPNPNNPIFSHRSTNDPVQSTGHADLVELPDGSWAMVYLGVRPTGPFPRFHLNGRETFLAGVDWVDDWPVVVDGRFAVPEPFTGFSDDFSAPALHPRWIAPGANPRLFTRRREAGGLRLLAGRKPGAREAERLLAVRARDAEWIATAMSPFGDVALVVRIDDEHWAAVERHGDTLSARVVIGPLDQVLATADAVGPEHPLALRTDATPGVVTGPDRIELGYLVGDAFRTLAAIDGRYLSSEVAGGFTGRVIGVEALGADADLARFTYQPREKTSTSSAQSVRP